jgi:hypothetical protein
MRFPRYMVNVGDRGSDRTVWSGIAATTRPPFGAVSGLATLCPCWPCAVPSMGVASAAGGGSWSAHLPGSVSFAVCACGMTSGPTSTRHSSRSGARCFAGSRCAGRGGSPDRMAISPTPPRPGFRRAGPADRSTPRRVRGVDLVRPPLPRVYSRQRGTYPRHSSGRLRHHRADRLAGWARSIARPTRT